MTPEKPRFQKLRKLLPAHWSSAPRPTISEPYGFFHVASGNPSHAMHTVVPDWNTPCREPVYDAHGVEIGLAKT